MTKNLDTKINFNIFNCLQSRADAAHYKNLVIFVFERRE